MPFLEAFWMSLCAPILFVLIILALSYPIQPLALFQISVYMYAFCLQVQIKFSFLTLLQRLHVCYFHSILHNLCLVCFLNAQF